MASPLGADKKEIHPLFVALFSVHDVTEPQAVPIQANSDFLLRLPDHGPDKRFHAIQMPGGQAVFPIVKSGIAPPRKKDVASLSEKQVYRGYDLESLALLLVALACHRRENAHKIRVDDTIRRRFPPPPSSPEAGIPTAEPFFLTGEPNSKISIELRVALR
jgi:hypothetical protein